MKRAESLARLNETFDVLVIGGGATGLGVALDSASRGYRTVLLEARDFAAGTSSRSTQLAHGGVRYLQQGNISLVRQALHERGLLLKNAPHLVHELAFLVPAYRVWERPFYGIGLKVYDVMAGSLKLSPTRVVSAKTVARLIPTIKREGLRGGVLYSDGQFNDARLALALARAASDHGAVLLNYAPVQALLKTGSRISGAIVTDLETGKEHTVRAAAVVNATGVFTDAIRRLDDPQAGGMMAVSQGIHVVLPESFLPGQTAIMVPRTRDGRVCFLIPWQGRALVGTTETPLPAPVPEPGALEEEIDFVLEHAGLYLRKQPTRADVLSVFAGLRPLVKSGSRNTARLSRDHLLVVSASGLVSITGGKWTTYRRMAEDVVNRLPDVAGLTRHPCVTADLRLPGAAIDGPWREIGATREEVASFEQRFAGDLHRALPYSMAMVAYVIENEMVVKVEDVMVRRLRAMLLDAKAAVSAAPQVAELMAALHGHGRDWVERELADVARLAAGMLVRERAEATDAGVRASSVDLRSASGIG